MLFHTTLGHFSFLLLTTLNHNHQRNKEKTVMSFFAHLLKTPNRHADDFGGFNATQRCLSCLVIQNSVIDQLATRLVVPLTKNKTRNSLYMKNLTSEIEFEGLTYLFLTQQLSSIPEDVLKDCIGSLEQSRELLIDAIDFAITGI